MITRITMTTKYEDLVKEGVKINKTTFADFTARLRDMANQSINTDETRRIILEFAAETEKLVDTNPAKLVMLLSVTIVTVFPGASAGMVLDILNSYIDHGDESLNQVDSNIIQ